MYWGCFWLGELAGLGGAAEGSTIPVSPSQPVSQSASSQRSDLFIQSQEFKKEKELENQPQQKRPTHSSFPTLP